MQQKNFLVFLLLTFVVMVGFTQVRQWLFPRPPADQVEKLDQAGLPVARPAVRGDGARAVLGPVGALALRQPRPAVRGDGAGAVLGPVGTLALRQRPTAPRAPAPVAAAPTAPSKLVRLGTSAGPGPSPFHLEVELDPRGAGVRRVVLNKFAAADAEGRPVWRDRATREPEPLELLPADANRETPAFALYHYDPRDLSDEHPLDTLGRVVWNVVGDKDKPVVEDNAPDGRPRQSVSFRTEADGVTITKTFSLTEGDYHLGLEVRLARKDEPGARDVPFRYQLAGGRGLPIEGEWYTSIFRNAMIATVQRGNVFRDLQDLRQIAVWEGGNEVVRDKDIVLNYAAIAVQYFASVIAVDDQQKRTDFLVKARPTLETAVVRGRIKSVAADKGSFVLTVGEHSEQSFYVPPKSDLHEELGLMAPREGQPVAVVYGTDGVMDEGKLRTVATRVLPQALAQPLFLSDITVRVSTEAVELKPGMEVTHKYVLYNGPVKPMLLEQLTGARAVPPEVVKRYLNDLHLDTLTDYHSPGPLGQFATRIYWSQLIIKCTNVMHWVLFWLHGLVPNYGVCIIVLTVLVRGMMFPVSRKQAMTSIRMQELAPEMKKLQEKYKDDRQALGAAQMELYRKYGVNPFGSCWFLLLQMPIFMGLYYCLQESIHFRLAEFWPTWIINLAAPDMLIPWGQSIPIISRPEDYGGMLYLGPFFNLLPVIAVTLMILQQKYTMPPPADEQQEMQQKMMKYMMVFFGLMFYKVDAGLCVYFISSSLWGFAERKLLPKKKPADGTAPPAPAAEGLLQRALRRARNGAGADAITTADALTTAGPAQGGSRRKKGKRRREDGITRTAGVVQESPPAGLRGWWQTRKEKLAAWWEEILRQAEKKR
jgi:YidC/Oxa1 family membrane protein insertase